ncbi:translation initiation factor IF-3 [Dehalogenimonas alkenigignens]|uniref:Translation initiation factor IF-3 n=2 Tax=Dehalogenimonas alkenigignens TaxID=1217799 RepID=A0A0W0GJA0_9CHLR|nr:translation initiation factor IF-3 [Dehalogenimonas alkenigignens]KTB48647.1 bacterial translation initiation factor 3 (bIF-3) [Dehalogenimonas alkenigignens]PVV84922.1 translation initiation factor IF-3 [Dehalogenimonas alkenigignens]
MLCYIYLCFILTGGSRHIIKELRINEKILGREVRVVGENGEQLGVMTVAQAKDMARRANVDLVEVAPTSIPPVCRLMDYGKYRYEQTKKEREAKKGQKLSLLKEVRLRPKIGEHDYEAKVRSVRKQLEDGDKVKLTIMFRGREITHSELGIKILKRAAEDLTDISTVEGQPTLLGSRIHLMLLPKTTNKGNKNKEGSLEDAETKNA